MAGGDGLECLRAHDVARKLGISTRVVFRLLKNGKLPGFKIGRTWLIRQSELEKYLLDLANAARAAQLKRSSV